jgi:hypothetical protein
MKRLFTFGDSFTQYFYPTWADILGQEFDRYENWGGIAAGNQFIFNSVTECLRRTITPNDTFIIMWTNIYREDRYIKNQWEFSGNLFSKELFNPEYYDDLFGSKFMDKRGCLIRDLALINATKTLLDTAKVNYIFLSTVPITQVGINAHQSDQKFEKNNIDVLNSYRDILNLIRPSIYETVFNYNWFSRPISNQLPNEEIRQKYMSLSGSSWPSYEDFIQANFQDVKQEIIDEIFKMIMWDLEPQLTKFVRDDFHPSTKDYLEYINTILPEFKISEKTKCWIEEETKIFDENKENYW